MLDGAVGGGGAALQPLGLWSLSSHRWEVGSELPNLEVCKEVSPGVESGDQVAGDGGSFQEQIILPQKTGDPHPTLAHSSLAFA